MFGLRGLWFGLIRLDIITLCKFVVVVRFGSGRFDVLAYFAIHARHAGNLVCLFSDCSVLLADKLHGCTWTYLPLVSLSLKKLDRTIVKR